MGDADVGGWFRPEVDGLRAVAVALVVAFHLGVGGFGGGWLGVDVFFVISGFVITRGLVRSHERAAVSGPPVQLRTFYAARVRRILPAALITFGAILWWIAVVYGRLSSVWAGQARSVALYASNIWFARTGVPYGAADSPFVHFWSLAVEEQFYVVWPLVIAVALRRSVSTRRLAVVAVVLAAVSFAYQVVASQHAPLHAFYLMPARGWELLAGAGLALAEPWVRSRRSPAFAALGWLGLGLLAVHVHRAPQPPQQLVTSLLVAVGAAVAVIASGLVGGTWSVARLLALRPMQAVGRHAYVIYLWHYPVIVAVDERGAPVVSRSADVLALTAVLAVATHALIEDPVRRWPATVRRPAATLAAGAAATAVALVAAVVVTWPVPLARELVAPVMARGSGGAEAEPGRPALGADPRALPVDATPFVPADLDPPLVRARAARPDAGGSMSRCAREVLATQVDPAEAARCSLGTPGTAATAPTVVLYGDSHARQWWSALQVLAQAHGWNLVVIWKGACAWMDSPPEARCASWRAAAERQLRVLHPAVVVLGAHDYITLRGTDRKAYRSAVRRAAAALPVGAVRVVLRDTQSITFDPARCLAGHLADVRPCDYRWPAGAERDLDQRVADAAKLAGATLVDPQPWVCDTERCPIIRGRYLVFSDESHLSAPFARSLAGRLERAMGPALQAVPGA